MQARNLQFRHCNGSIESSNRLRCFAEPANTPERELLAERDPPHSPHAIIPSEYPVLLSGKRK